MARIFGQYVLADMLALWVFETLACFLILMATSGNVSFVPLPGHHRLIHLGPLNSALLSIALGLSCVSVGLYKASSFPSINMLLPLALIAGVGTMPAAWILAAVEEIDPRRLADHPAWIAELVSFWLAVLIATRLLYASGVRRGLFVRDVLVLGSGTRAVSTIAAIGSLGSGLLRTWQAEPSAPGVGRRPGPLRIVLATDGHPGEALPAGWSGRFTRFSDPDTFWERHLGRVDLEGLPDRTRGTTSIGTGAASGRARAGTERAADLVRRTLDIGISLLLLLALAPVMAATAISIRLDSPGPVIYRQRRIGLDGRAFTILKFRSMRTDAERDGVPQFARIGDARTTSVGHFIRKVRIDELPQLFNILRGDMAIVGPRPERPDFVERYRDAIPFYELRHAVRPGLTGWAQIHCPYTASDSETREKLSYDLYYVRNRSLALDLSVMIATIRVILFQVGAR